MPDDDDRDGDGYDDGDDQERDDGAWDDLIGEARDWLDGRSDDDSFADTLHELYDLDRELFEEAIYEITSDPQERHELWTAAMYE